MYFSAPLKFNSTKVMLLGSGELGKEVAIEAQRLGLEVIAVDSYYNAPAHQVAHERHVVDMQNKDELLDIIRRVRPDYILPEIEALNIEALFEAEKEGFNVVPNAEAVSKTMNRRKIRKFVAEELGLKTSAYKFVSSYEELEQAAEELGYPCVIKPIMSSSGHGQSIAGSKQDLQKSWSVAKEARGDSSELIVEEFINFDLEITLLTIKNGKETVFCEPIGHEQKDGDYIFSWQPAFLSPDVKQKAEEIAKKVTDGLGGVGVFGVEFFVKDSEVYFSEVSPRPHDTGMVTLITQSQSEFALHIRAILGLPLGFTFFTPGASAAYKAKRDSVTPVIYAKDEVFASDSFLRVFSKPKSYKGRRMALLLAMASSESEALKKVKERVGYIEDYTKVTKIVESEHKKSEDESCIIKKVFKFIFGK